MPTVLVDVTRADIEAGSPGQSWGCPVALAAARATGARCMVRHVRIFVGLHALPLPPQAQDFVRRFDTGLGRPEPFSFTLNLPE